MYALLLSDVDVQLSSLWVKATLHEILPLFLLADWIRLSAQSRSPAARTMSKRT